MGGAPTVMVGVAPDAFAGETGWYGLSPPFVPTGDREYIELSLPSKLLLVHSSGRKRVESMIGTKRAQISRAFA